MKQISHVSIPDPCTQNWDNMLPDAGGKFCDSCQKSVIDFTKLSNTQILKFLSSSSNVCGRFDPSQLNNLNSELEPEYKLPVWQKVGILASLISLMPFVAAKAQVKHKVEQHTPIKTLVGAISAKIVLTTITGTVVDSVSNKPVALVRVDAKSSQSHVLTDSLGNFRIEISPGNDTVLTFSTVGYQVHTIKVNRTQTNYNVRLAAQEITFPQQEALTGLVGGISVRRSFLWMAWYHIKKPFKNLLR